MSILDLAFRFNSPLSGGNGSVPAGTNLGQQASSDRSLNLLVKRPARRAWDTWDSSVWRQPWDTWDAWDTWDTWDSWDAWDSTQAISKRMVRGH
jgi:hypothetical protein